MGKVSEEIFIIFFIFCKFPAAAAASSDREAWNNKHELVFRVEGQTTVGLPLPTVRGQGVKVSQTVRIARQSPRTYLLKVREFVILFPPGLNLYGTKIWIFSL